MITIATIADETKISTGRGRGRQGTQGESVRHRAAVAVDKFNIILAMANGEGNFIGKKFLGSMVHLARMIESEGYDLAKAEAAVRAGLQIVFPEQNVSKMTWADFDKKLGFNKRTKDSTGCLAIYEELKKAGLAEAEESSESDSEE